MVPCFIYQLVGHRAVDCPKRVCYSCGQKGHLARDCSSRQIKTDKRCQGCGQEGVVLLECQDALEAPVTCAGATGPQSAAVDVKSTVDGVELRSSEGMEDG